MIVKVCGMRQALNIRLVEQLPVDWMGFIFYPRSSRYVETVPEYLPTRQKRVGVFVNAGKEFILNRVAAFGLHYVQLHGDETPDDCRLIKTVTKRPVIKAFGISRNTDFQKILSYEGAADYFLFDTKTESYGGSGRTFDHTLLRRYTGATPFILSGGLGPDSLDDIRAFSHPAWVGIDLNSRFEQSPALKNVGLLQKFLTSLGRQF